MYDVRRHITTLCAAAGLLLVSASAHAWVESEVRSQIATVDVDRSGLALVTEDLTLGVRGGPLPGFELSGGDLDAEPLPDATVTSVSGTKANVPVTPLTTATLSRRLAGTPPEKSPPSAAPTAARSPAHLRNLAPALPRLASRLPTPTIPNSSPRSWMIQNLSSAGQSSPACVCTSSVSRKHGCYPSTASCSAA